MTLAYIHHSGFALETESFIMVFDYWMDPAGIMPTLCDKGKHIYVFSSHFHEDHFTREIFSWKEQYTSTNFTYLLSKDILRHRRAEKEEANAWLAKGGTWEDENLKVFATGSTDSGVSWIVECEGKRVFHAGDLCNWDISDEKRFIGELKDIHKITDSFDIVMFPVDARIGKHYTLGGKQFLDRFRVGTFIPMHFTSNGFESTMEMIPLCQEKNVAFGFIRKNGDMIGFADDLLIQRTTPENLSQLKGIFAHARKFMTETGNPHQWAENYPSDEILQKDRESRSSFVCLKDHKIVATFVLKGGKDPTYDEIFGGEWLSDKPYATIHRIASSGEVKGIFHTVLKFALEQYRSIRIDTHRDNQVIQNAILKEGFRYCGIIHCWNGEERLAYQLDK